MIGEFFGFYPFWIKEFSEWVYISSIIKRKNYVKKPNNTTNWKRHKHLQWLPMYLCMHGSAWISQGPETVNSVITHGSLVHSSSVFPTFSFQINFLKYCDPLVILLLKCFQLFLVFFRREQKFHSLELKAFCNYGIQLAVSLITRIPVSWLLAVLFLYILPTAFHNSSYVVNSA